MNEENRQSEQTDADEQQLPEASFAQLVAIFTTQALFELGEIQNPLSGKTEINLGRAKMTIGMLELIQEKTSGNLTEEEKNLLDSQLYELKMKFVNKSS